jgi:hypothetical protein
MRIISHHTKDVYESYHKMEALHTEKATMIEK